MSENSWFDVIRRQGEISRREQLERVEELRKQLPVAILTIRAMNNHRIIDYLIESTPKTYSSLWDGGEAAVWSELVQQVKDEILRRMEP